MNPKVACTVVAFLLFSACAHTQIPSSGSVFRPRSVDPASADVADLVAAAVSGKLDEAQWIFSALEHRWRSFSPIEQSFLRGVAKVELGQFTEARDLLRDVAGHFAELDDYAWFFLGEAALGAGDAGLASQAFGRVATYFPASRWYNLAKQRLVAVAMSEGKWNEANDLLEEIRQRRTKGSPDLEIQLKFAELAVRRGDESAAGGIYTSLYRGASSPVEINSIRAGLDLFRKRFSYDPVARLAADDRIDLARLFMGRGLSGEAASLLEKIPAGERSSDYAELLGQAYYKARRYTDAYKHLCVLADHGGYSMDKAMLLRLCGTAAARAGVADEAVRRNRQIMDEFPATTSSSTALYKLSFLLMDSGKYKAAIDGYRAWLGYQNQPHSGGEGEAPRALPVEGATRAPVTDALWAIAWCHYRLGEWDAALAAMNELDSLVGSSGDWGARVSYWRARILDASGKKKEAKGAYREVAEIHGNNYYGQMARARMKGEYVPASFVLDERLSISSHHAPTQFKSAKAATLSRLGLWQYAFEEEDSSGADAGLYRAAVDRLGERWGLDFDLVHALIRQESQYKANAVSPAGAIGLMQLMPATAARLARELHWRDFSSVDLYRPIVNVRLGMWYLRELSLKFDGMIPLMLASYNAGEDAVDRWISLYWLRRGGGHARKGIEIDEFVEEIPYRETFNYVKKVLRYYAGS